MSLSIRPVDPWDEDEMDVLQALYVEAAPRRGPRRPRLLARRQRGPTCDVPRAASFYHAFAGFEGDQMVGQTWVVGSTIDNLHLAHLWAWVPPRFGRRGHGTALVEVRRAAPARPGPAYRRHPDLDRRRLRRLSRRSPSGSATRWRRPRSSAASGCRWTRRRWPGWRRRPPATARDTRCAPSLGPIPDDLVPGLPHPLQPDERRDAHRRHRARGGSPHSRGAGPAGGRAPRRRAAPG